VVLMKTTLPKIDQTRNQLPSLMSGLETSLFQTTMPIRWSDVDADGRVNNVQFLRFVEEARMQWASSLKLEKTAPGLAPVVAALDCTFHTAMRYPSMVHAEIFCTRLGRTSLTLRCELSTQCQISGQEIAAATSNFVWVWTDLSTGSSVPLPHVLREYCEA